MIPNSTQKYTIVLLIVIAFSLTACRKDQQKVVPSQRDSGYVDMPIGSGSHYDSSVFDDDVEAFVLEQEGLEGPFGQSNNDVRLAYNQSEATVEDFTFEQLDSKDEMHTVYFPYDRKEPGKDQQESLKLTAKKAQEMYQSGRVICCKGHSCKWHGTSAYNLALSMNRANTIASYLENEAGIPKERIKIFGVGNEEPIALENSKDGQGPNRRVEVYALAA